MSQDNIKEDTNPLTKAEIDSEINRLIKVLINTPNGNVEQIQGIKEKLAMLKDMKQILKSEGKWHSL